MTAQKFRKKPLVIEAMQWDGTPEDASDILDWVLAHGGTARYHSTMLVDTSPTVPFIAVDTLDATAKVFAGDWMMRGTVGEFYPCQSDVFNESYEHVRDTPVGEMSDEGLNRLMQDVTGSTVNHDGTPDVHATLGAIDFSVIRARFDKGERGPDKAFITEEDS